jgi:oligopeptidase B
MTMPGVDGTPARTGRWGRPAEPDEAAWSRLLEHLQAETRRCADHLSCLEPLRRTLVAEFRAREPRLRLDSLRHHEPWWYWTAPGVDGAHLTLRRIAGHPPAEADAGELVLDLAEIAGGGGDVMLGGWAPSPSGDLLAYTVDRSGAEAYVLRLRDLATGRETTLGDRPLAPDIAWSAPGDVLHCLELDQALRPWRVRRLRVDAGAAVADAGIVHEDPGEAAYLSLAVTRDGRLTCLYASDHTGDEVFVWDGRSTAGKFSRVLDRREDTHYAVEHHAGQLLAVVEGPSGTYVAQTSLTAVGGETSARHWQSLITIDADVSLESVDLIGRHLVLTERRDGMLSLRTITLKPTPDATLRVSRHRQVPLDEHLSAVDTVAGTAAEGGGNGAMLYFRHTSFVTAPRLCAYDLDRDGAPAVLVDTAAPGYTAGSYTAERLAIPAPDGTPVPVTVLRRADRPTRPPSPLVLYAYGAYGISLDPTFSHFRLSLLDRGIAFALAHVRGGGDLGPSWHAAGRGANKSVGVDDLLACAHGLIAAGHTTPDRLILRGRSAGGFLVGAALNAEPRLFRAAAAEVPFVDCLATLEDADAPYTPLEWGEWGNPTADPAARASLAALSPCENVQAQPYPSVLATAALNDTRVGPWEAATWVARLRAATTADAPILLSADLETGHLGHAGNDGDLAEEAFVLAFIVHSVSGDAA